MTLRVLIVQRQYGCMGTEDWTPRANRRSLRVMDCFRFHTFRLPLLHAIEKAGAFGMASGSAIFARKTASTSRQA